MQQMISPVESPSRMPKIDSTSKPETLSLYYSRGRQYFFLLIFAPPLAFYLYFLAVSHINVLTLLFAPLAIVLARSCFQSIMMLHWEGPVVVLDSVGITDFRQGGEPVPWRCVVKAELGSNGAVKFLTLRFRTMELARRYMGTRRFYWSWLDDSLMPAGQWRTSLTPLAIKHRDVVQRANQFIIRERSP